jgi:hypothetical protein
MAPVNTRTLPRSATLIGSGVSFRIVLALKLRLVPAPRVSLITSSMEYGVGRVAIDPLSPAE